MCKRAITIMASMISLILFALIDSLSVGTLATPLYSYSSHKFTGRYFMYIVSSWDSFILRWVPCFPEKYSKTGRAGAATRWEARLAGKLTFTTPTIGNHVTSCCWSLVAGQRMGRYYATTLRLPLVVRDLVCDRSKPCSHQTIRKLLDDSEGTRNNESYAKYPSSDC